MDLKKNKILFDNCKIYSDANEFLSYTSKRKVLWYVKKGLADIIKSTDDEVSIKLKFKPKHNNIQKHPYNTGVKDNKCAVCACVGNLTTHHIVPYEYRKVLDSKYTNHNSYDIIGLCVDCHIKYESYAMIYKKYLIDSLVPNYYISLYNDWLNINRIYEKIDDIGEDIDMLTNKFLSKKIQKVLDVWCGLLTYSDFINMELIPINKYIINVLGSETLIKMWQYHFIEYAQPKYMPDWWVVGKIYETNNQQVINI